MTASTISEDGQTEKIFAWRRGFNAMHLIDIGVEVGLFKALAAAPNGLTAPALAQPNSFDAAVMIEVLHEIAPALRANIMGAWAKVLRLGGWLVIIDETYPTTPEEMRQKDFLFPVQTGFEELMWGNVILTRQEQKNRCAKRDSAVRLTARLSAKGLRS